MGFITCSFVKTFGAQEAEWVCFTDNYSFLFLHLLGLFLLLLLLLMNWFVLALLVGWFSCFLNPFTATVSPENNQYNLEI